MRKSAVCYPHMQVCEWMHQDPHPAQPHPTHSMTKLSQTLQGAGLVPRRRHDSFTAPVFQMSQLHRLKFHSRSLKHPSCRTSQPKCTKHNVFYLTAEFEASQLQHLKLHSCSLKCPSCKIWNFTTKHNKVYLAAEFEASQLQYLKLHSCSSKCPSCRIWCFTAAEFEASQLQCTTCNKVCYLFDCGTDSEPCQKPHSYIHMENKFMKGWLPELCICYRNKIKNRDAGFWQPTRWWYGSCV